MIEFIVFVSYVLIGFAVVCALVRRNQIQEVDQFLCLLVLWPLVIAMSFAHYVIKDIKRG